jgi:hypothetical protein
MALDRPDGDDLQETAGNNPEKRQERPSLHVDGVSTLPGLTETRSRAEYFKQLHAAFDQHSHQFGEADTGSDASELQSAWDVVDATTRPPLDAFNVTPERAAHILDGDATGGGGHRHGVGKPGKTEFPADWNDERIVGSILEVVRHPSQPPVHQDWNNRWLCVGVRDEVEISVVVQRTGEVWTAWPEEGSPGVVRNPRGGKP